MDWDIDIDIETSPTRGHVFLHHLIGILIVTNAADMLRDRFFPAVLRSCRQVHATWAN